MTDTPAALDDAPFMRALLDVLIPARTDLPAAGDLVDVRDVAGPARGDQMLGPAIESGLQSLRDAALAKAPGGLPAMDATAAREFVQAQLSGLLAMALLRYVYPLYYQHPRVLEAIGEPPRPPFPLGFDVEPTDPALLTALEARRKKA